MLMTSSRMAAGEKGVPVFRVSFPGPFSQHEVVVDGWSVPFLHAHPGGEHDDSVMLVLDNRLAATFSVEEAERFVPFLADAIAIALGYTAHPRSDEEPNWKPQPRPVRMSGIGAVATEDADDHEAEMTEQTGGWC